MTAESVGEDWENVAALIPEKFDHNEASRLIAIIDSTTDLDCREAAMKALDGGRLWDKLMADIFPMLRRCTMQLVMPTEEEATPDSDGEVTTVADEPETTPEHMTGQKPADETETAIIAEHEPTVNEINLPAEHRHWYLKTNLPAWAMLWANLQAEIDGDPHWSFVIPIYYSGWNYFSDTHKYRTFTVLPEARYWLRPDNRGFFVNAHAGFAFYNVAFGNETRYQDHDASTPAIGGGVGLGYRFDLNGQEGRWKMEVSMGAGIYALDYDLFENRHNGPRYSREKKTFFGIDNVALSLIYRFDIRRKEGASR